MKIAVQIPCYNEAPTIARVIEVIKRTKVANCSVEVVIIDDGCTDLTVPVARDAGADYILRHRFNRGLGAAFVTGMNHCLDLSADIIVNTDGDNQYVGEDLQLLVAPLLAGTADIVVGDRQISSNRSLPFSRRLIQWLGTFVVRILSGLPVTDAASGFRAFSRYAASRLNLVSTFSHTMETLLQAKAKGLRVVFVPIRTNSAARASHLYNSTWQYIWLSAKVIVRTHYIYRLPSMMLKAGMVFMGLSLVPILWCICLLPTYEWHVFCRWAFSGCFLMAAGVVLAVLGLILDSIGHNRQLLELSLERLRDIQAQRCDVNVAAPVTNERKYPHFPTSSLH